MSTIEGVGPNAPTHENSMGGKQSDIPYRFDLIPSDSLFRVAAVLKTGADKYGIDNWKNIPVSDHLNHLLMHVQAFLSGDTQDDHLSHSICRALFADHLHNRPIPQTEEWFVVEGYQGPPEKLNPDVDIPIDHQSDRMVSPVHSCPDWESVGVEDATPEQELLNQLVALQKSVWNFRARHPGHRIIYVAGPMRGYENWNFDQFHLGVRWLQTQFAPEAMYINPAETDWGSTDRSAEWYLKYAFVAVSLSDTVFLLDGWQKSEGATTEALIAAACGHDLFKLDLKSNAYYRLSPLSQDEILRTVYETRSAGWPS